MATLWDTAAGIGHLAWSSRQVFSLAGTWARDDRTPELARRLGTLSNQHGRIAARCVERLPTIVLADGTTRTPEQFVVHPDLGEEQVLLAGATATDEARRQRVLSTALTRMQAQAAAMRADIDPLLDEPTAALLDDVLLQLDRQLTTLGGDIAGSVMGIVPDRRRSS